MPKSMVCRAVRPRFTAFIGVLAASLAGVLCVQVVPAGAATTFQVGYSTPVSPMSALKEGAALVGAANGQTAMVSFPGTLKAATLFWGSSGGEPGTVTDADRANVSLAVDGTASALSAGSLKRSDGSAWSYYATVTSSIPGSGHSVSVSNIEGIGAGWALLVVYVDSSLPANRRSQVIWETGMTTVTPSSSTTITFPGVAASSAPLGGSVGFAAVGGTSANESIAFSNNSAGFPSGTVGDFIDNAAGTTTYGVSAPPAAGAGAVALNLASPVSGDTYYPLVAVYQHQWDDPALTLTQQVSNATTPGAGSAVSGDRVGVTVDVAHTAGTDTATKASYALAALPTGTTLVNDGIASVYTDSSKTTPWPNTVDTTTGLQVALDNLSGSAADHFYFELQTTSAAAPTLTVDGAVHGSSAATNQSVADTRQSSPPSMTVIREPDPPTGVTAVAGDRAADVSWLAPGFDGGSAVSGYTATSSPDGKTCTASAATTHCAVTGLTNDVNYTFTVVATNSVGNSAASSPSAGVVPVDTTSPTVAVTALPRYSLTSKVTLTYTGADNNGVTAYDVRYRSAPYDGSFGSLVYLQAWQNTTKTSVALTATRGSTYCFQVRSKDADHNVSGWSTETCTAVPLDDRALTAGTGWARDKGSAYYAGTVTRTTHKGAVLTRTHVRARQIAVVATTCPSCGKIAIYWNGDLVKRISLTSATTHAQRVLVAVSFASVSRGTVTIKTLSTGSVRIDGLALGKM
jgi:hypothetical protein